MTNRSRSTCLLLLTDSGYPERRLRRMSWLCQGSGRNDPVIKLLMFLSPLEYKQHEDSNIAFFVFCCILSAHNNAQHKTEYMYSVYNIYNRIYIREMITKHMAYLCLLCSKWLYTRKFYKSRSLCIVEIWWSSPFLKRNVLNIKVSNSDLYI